MRPARGSADDYEVINLTGPSARAVLSTTASPVDGTLSKNCSAPPLYPTPLLSYVY